MLLWYIRNKINLETLLFTWKHNYELGNLIIWLEILLVIWKPKFVSTIHWFPSWLWSFQVKSDVSKLIIAFSVDVSKSTLTVFRFPSLNSNFEFQTPKVNFSFYYCFHFLGRKFKNIVQLLKSHSWQHKFP